MSTTYIPQAFPLYVVAGRFGVAEIVIGWRVYDPNEKGDVEMVPVTVPVGMPGYAKLHDGATSFSTEPPMVARLKDPRNESRDELARDAIGYAPNLNVEGS